MPSRLDLTIAVDWNLKNQAGGKSLGILKLEAEDGEIRFLQHAREKVWLGELALSTWLDHSCWLKLKESSGGKKSGDFEIRSRGWRNQVSSIEIISKALHYLLKSIVYYTPCIYASFQLYDRSYFLSSHSWNLLQNFGLIFSNAVYLCNHFIKKHSYFDHNNPEELAFTSWLLTLGDAGGQNLGHL